MQMLVDMDFLFWSKVKEVKVLGYFPHASIVVNTYRRKDGSYGTREEYGVVAIQMPAGICGISFSFAKTTAGVDRFLKFVKEFELDKPEIYRIPDRNKEQSYVQYELPVEMVNIDFTVDRKWAGRKTKGEGILFLPLKGWNGDSLYLDFPTYEREGQYRHKLWPKSAYGRIVRDNISRGAVDACLAFIGAYHNYDMPPVTTYNGKVMLNGCHNCKYCHRFLVDQEGEIPNISLMDMKELEITKVHNCYCTLHAKKVLEEAFDLINESLANDSDWTLMYDRLGYEYFTLTGKGKVKYGDRVLGWLPLLEAAGSAECCPHYAFAGLTNRNTYYNAPNTPSTIFHQGSHGQWVLGKPEVGYIGSLGFLCGNHMLVTVDHPLMVDKILAHPTVILQHEVRDIVYEAPVYNSLEEWRQVMTKAILKLMKVEEDLEFPTSPEGLLRILLEDIAMCPQDDDIQLTIFYEVVDILGITNEQYIDASFELLDLLYRQHNR